MTIVLMVTVCKLLTVGHKRAGLTTLRESSAMAPSRPSCLMPILSRALTTTAATKPSMHSRAPGKQKNTVRNSSSQAALHFLVNVPPHSVHCMPYLSSNFSVKKKLRTEPRREKASVTPKARASSFPLNQKAVMRFCTTGKTKQGCSNPSLSHTWDNKLDQIASYWSKIHCRNRIVNVP